MGRGTPALGGMTYGDRPDRIAVWLMRTAGGLSDSSYGFSQYPETACIISMPDLRKNNMPEMQAGNVVRIMYVRHAFY